jgi:colanic acid/amylovoran biosynthesis glycosyltransferase
MTLFLFSNHFPYQHAEPFLVNEFPYAAARFSSIWSFSLYGSQNTTVTSDKLSANYFFNVGLDKSRLILKGIFNRSPLNFHTAEFFRKKLFFHPRQAYWFFISLCITRAALASDEYKKLTRELRLSTDPVLYFFWSDNLCWLLPYLMRALACKKPRVVLRLHGTDLYEHRKAGYAPLREKIFDLSDLICPVSANGAAYLSHRYPRFAGKISVARLGVPDRGVNHTGLTTKFLVVSASSVIKLKQVHLIFEALLLGGLNIDWHHFGGGPLFEALRSRAGNAGPGLKVHLHGQVPNEVITNFYRTSHVSLFVNSSSTEGLPVTIMEALSFGIPVVAPDVGGISELVNSSVGRLVPARFSPAELLKAMVEVLTLTETDAREMREQARRMFEAKVNAADNYPLFFDRVCAL